MFTTMYMENMERQKFDDAWQDALTGGEQSPSENVWAAIDNKLTVAEGGTMKRRVIFYQRLAAASILFAVVFGSLTAYYINENNNQSSSNQLAKNESIVNQPINGESGQQLPSEQLPNEKLAVDQVKESETVKDQAQSDEQRVAGNTNDILGNEKIIEHKLSKQTEKQLADAQSDKNAEVVTRNSVTSNEKITASKNKYIVEKENVSGGTAKKQSILLAGNNNAADNREVLHDVRTRNGNFATLSIRDIPSPEPHTAGNVREVTIIRILPAMPASMMADSRKDKKMEKENLWASIGASTGNYSPQGNFNQPQVLASPGFSNLVSSQSTTTTNSARSKGTAYSVGVNLAKKVSERWLVLGGLSYLNQSSGYTSSVASVSANNSISVYSADYVSKQSNAGSAIALTSPYEVNSVNELVSVPMQAGYLLINRKIALQINSGVATNIFLQNTLTDKSGQLNKLTESAGSDSPYKSFSWSAIMGSELSYKIGDQYRVSLVPGLRYPLSPVLKSSTTTDNSMIWDLGFRFRFIFK
jgi:hypothetical protein